jgi:alanine racemase
MFSLLRKILQPKYETLNIIKINAANLTANFQYLKSLQPAAEIFPVLKSNAYGHGLKEVCQILNSTSAPMVAVDSYPEAQIAYRYFRGQVLILSEMPLRVYDYCPLKRTEFVVYNTATLKYLSRFGRRAKIHLFINSGMNREGIKDISKFIEQNRRYLVRVEVSGLCSHLAAADQDSRLNQEQEDNFLAALDIVRAAGFFPRWVHLGNSAAMFTSKNKLLTAFRPGLAFYGYHPFQNEEGTGSPLQPALEIYSRLVSLQNLAPGEAVSYGENYRVATATQIGVIPFGYFEGLDRRLSNRAKFLVSTADNSFWAPVAGNVCMNLTCLEIGQNEAQIGDPVQVVSKNPSDPNSVSRLADLEGTIPYEFLVKLPANIRREIIR